jgi:hypothetical protein
MYINIKKREQSRAEREKEKKGGSQTEMRKD